MDVRLVDPGEALTEADIAQAEQQTGHTFPAAYRSFLLASNGGRPEQPVVYSMQGLQGGANHEGTVDRFFGIKVKESINLEHYADLYRDRVPANLLPIARDPGDNLVCIGTKGVDSEKVYFWDHEEEADEGQEPTYDNLYLVANTFGGFLDNLRLGAETS